MSLLKKYMVTQHEGPRQETGEPRFRPPVPLLHLLAQTVMLSEHALLQQCCQHLFVQLQHQEVLLARLQASRWHRAADASTCERTRSNEVLHNLREDTSWWYLCVGVYATDRAPA